ncbi:MAG: hypothetical protein AAGH15_27075 [Myxococcota bacterium]
MPTLGQSREAEAAIERGLGPVARGLIGLTAMLASGLFCLSSSAMSPAWSGYVMAGLTVCLGLACVTRGRFRRFVGSVVGATVFAASLVYLASQFAHGEFVDDRDGPSMVSAGFFFGVFGLPALRFVLRNRFGWGPPPEPLTDEAAPPETF